MDSTSSSSSSSSSSLVSRARTALHSAAAKAEKVLIDIKTDLKSDRDVDKRSWRGLKERMGGSVSDDVSSRRSKPDEDNVRSGTAENCDVSACKRVSIPPTSIVKQLAMAIENGKYCSSINDLLDPGKGSYHVGERAARSFSAVKSLVLREKDKSDSESLNDEEINSLVVRLFNEVPEEDLARHASISMDLKDIHGAPVGSFIARTSEIIGSLKSLHNMASFWLSVVAELKRFWMEGKSIPHMPYDEKPDLNSCLLHQQLQVINCCIARKKRWTVAAEALESLMSHNDLNNIDQVNHTREISGQAIYAKTKSGEYILRLGADQPVENLSLLDTGEPIYSPVTQEGPVLTVEHIKEAEEFMLRTGSLGAGCSQLLSDMQAFKAANPGCILEDFIRWHSPPDWMEDQDETDKFAGVDLSSKRGKLSKRMQKEGNLWRELWETSKALPAVKQAPLFDEDLAVESVFAALEEISPSELFLQLFISILFSTFIIVGAALSMENSLTKLYNDCKDHAIAVFQDRAPKDHLSDLCKVYETVEMILIHPEDAIELTKQTDEINSTERKSLFRKFGLNFTIRDRQNPDNAMPKEQKKSDEKGPNVFSNFFDGKKSLFSKKDSKSSNSKHSDPSGENDWMLV